MSQRTTRTHTDPDAPELLNVNQAASLLNISRRQVERLISTGNLPGAVKIGGCRRIHEPTLKRWIEAGCPDAWRHRNQKKSRQ